MFDDIKAYRQQQNLLKDKIFIGCEVPLLTEEGLEQLYGKDWGNRLLTGCPLKKLLLCLGKQSKFQISNTLEQV